MRLVRLRNGAGDFRSHSGRVVFGGTVSYRCLPGTAAIGARDCRSWQIGETMRAMAGRGRARDRAVVGLAPSASTGIAGRLPQAGSPETANSGWPKPGTEAGSSPALFRCAVVYYDRIPTAHVRVRRATRCAGAGVKRHRLTVESARQAIASLVILVFRKPDHSADFTCCAGTIALPVARRPPRKDSPSNPGVRRMRCSCVGIALGDPAVRIGYECVRRNLMSPASRR